jgi:lysophospholipase L1-like esterase
MKNRSLVAMACVVALAMGWGAAPPAAAAGDPPAPSAEFPLPAVAALAGDDTPLIPGERIVFLGDSITEQGNHPGGYVDLIRQALAPRHDLAVEVIGAGVGGNKVPNLQARLQADVLDRQPTVVFVYIGINDVWHGAGGTPLDRYEEGLNDLLDRLDRSGAVTVLATPSVIGEKPDGSNPNDPKLEAYAAVSRKVAATHHVAVFDLRRAFEVYKREHNPKNVQAGNLTQVTVHLTALGNRFVAEQAAAAITSALRERAGYVIIPSRKFVNTTKVHILIRSPKTTSVYYTLDGSEPTEQSARYTQPFEVNKTTRVRALGVSHAKAGGRFTAEGLFEQVTPLPPGKMTDLTPGITYEVYPGGYTRLPRFDSAAMAGQAKHGTAADFTLPTGQGDSFGVRFHGYLDVPTTGVYEFTLVSDDGSTLRVGPDLVVDNDGAHGPVARKGQIALRPGKYPLTLDYFNAGGGAMLELSWSRDGAPATRVPASALFRNSHE